MWHIEEAIGKWPCVSRCVCADWINSPLPVSHPPVDIRVYYIPAKPSTRFPALYLFLFLLWCLSFFPRGLYTLYLLWTTFFPPLPSFSSTFLMHHLRLLYLERKCEIWNIWQLGKFVQQFFIHGAVVRLPLQPLSFYESNYWRRRRRSSSG